MSMGNFNGVRVVVRTGMAPDDTTRSTDAASEQDSSDLGVAHLTVVPTNFDPDAPGHRPD